MVNLLENTGETIIYKAISNNHARLAGDRYRRVNKEK